MANTQTWGVTVPSLKTILTCSAAFIALVAAKQNVCSDWTGSVNNANLRDWFNRRGSRRTQGRFLTVLAFCIGWF